MNIAHQTESVQQLFGQYRTHIRCIPTVQYRDNFGYILFLKIPNLSLVVILWDMVRNYKSYKLKFCTRWTRTNWGLPSQVMTWNTSVRSRNFHPDYPLDWVFWPLDSNCETSIVNHTNNSMHCLICSDELFALKLYF